jgi:cytosine/uracil/thiamine/allantoin permease
MLARRFSLALTHDNHVFTAVKNCQSSAKASPPRQPLTIVQEVEHDHGLSNQELFLTNHDLKIVEPERRQWSAFNFVGFWIADSFNINTWMIAASSLDVGLSWWQAWICVWYELF